MRSPRSSPRTPASAIFMLKPKTGRSWKPGAQTSVTQIHSAMRSTMAVHEEESDFHVQPRSFQCPERTQSALSALPLPAMVERSAQWLRLASPVVSERLVDERRWAVLETLREDREPTGPVQTAAYFDDGSGPAFASFRVSFSRAHSSQLHPLRVGATWGKSTTCRKRLPRRRLARWRRRLVRPDSREPDMLVRAWLAQS